MKITSKILSIPPYLSTTWKNIASLHAVQEGPFFVLSVLFQNQKEIKVPGLSKEAIQEILEGHARFHEELSKPSFESPLTFAIPAKLDTQFELFTPAMQHNPEQANLPPIPPDILKKLTMIGKAFGLDDSLLSKPEPHCQCMYCQLVRAFQGGSSSEAIEEVSQEDLKFRDWEIQQVGEQLYQVTNPLDANEHYNVFLGTPLGCTCGKQNCEHIRAVLNT